jgi:hypothetical protein
MIVKILKILVVVPYIKEVIAAFKEGKYYYITY